MIYFDAHCHITSDKDISPDVALITNAAQVSDWAGIIQLSRCFKNVYGAIGVHPWYLDGLDLEWDKLLFEKLVQYPDLMVGEIGLDKNRPNPQKQITVFSRQIELAAELNRGVHIHCIGMWNDTLNVLRAHHQKLPPFILFHRYAGSTSIIDILANEYNAYFSYNRTDNPRISGTPPTRILLETDSDNPSQIKELYKSFLSCYPEYQDRLYENATKLKLK